MLLKDLTLAEKAALLGTSALKMTSIFHEKSADDIVEEDIKQIRDKLNRLLDLIEEFGFDGKKLQ